MVTQTQSYHQAMSQQSQPHCKTPDHRKSPLERLKTERGTNKQGHRDIALDKSLLCYDMWRHFETKLLKDLQNTAYNKLFLFTRGQMKQHASCRLCLPVRPSMKTCAKDKELLGNQSWM